MRTLLVSGLGLLLAVTASAQEQPQLKARELFYTPITETKPTPAKETPSKAAIVKPPKSKPANKTRRARRSIRRLTSRNPRPRPRDSPAERYVG